MTKASRLNSNLRLNGSCHHLKTETNAALMLTSNIMAQNVVANYSQINAHI